MVAIAQLGGDIAPESAVRLDCPDCGIRLEEIDAIPGIGGVAQAAQFCASTGRMGFGELVPWERLWRTARIGRRLQAGAHVEPKGSSASSWSAALHPIP